VVGGAEGTVPDDGGCWRCDVSNAETRPPRPRGWGGCAWTGCGILAL